MEEDNHSAEQLVEIFDGTPALTEAGTPFQAVRSVLKMVTV